MARLCDDSVIVYLHYPTLADNIPDCCGLRGTVYYRCHVLRSAPRPCLPPILLFISTTVASILSPVALAIDAGIVGALQKIIHDDTDGPVTLTWGNGMSTRDLLSRCHLGS